MVHHDRCYRARAGFNPVVGVANFADKFFISLTKSGGFETATA